MNPCYPITVYPKKYAHGFCCAVLCCGYTLTDFPIFIRLTSLALWQSNDCPSASKASLMNMDKYFMWIHYERLHNHNKAKHNKTVCIFLGIYCIIMSCCDTVGQSSDLEPKTNTSFLNHSVSYGLADVSTLYNSDHFTTQQHWQIQQFSYKKIIWKRCLQIFDYFVSISMCSFMGSPQLLTH